MQHRGFSNKSRGVTLKRVLILAFMTLSTPAAAGRSTPGRQTAPGPGRAIAGADQRKVTVRHARRDGRARRSRGPGRIARYGVPLLLLSGAMTGASAAARPTARRYPWPSDAHPAVTGNPGQPIPPRQRSRVQAEAPDGFSVKRAGWELAKGVTDPARNAFLHPTRTAGVILAAKVLDGYVPGAGTQALYCLNSAQGSCDLGQGVYQVATGKTPRLREQGFRKIGRGAVLTQAGARDALRGRGIDPTGMRPDQVVVENFKALKGSVSDTARFAQAGAQQAQEAAVRKTFRTTGDIGKRVLQNERAKEVASQGRPKVSTQFKQRVWGHTTEAVNNYEASVARREPPSGAHPVYKAFHKLLHPFEEALLKKDAEATLDFTRKYGVKDLRREQRLPTKTLWEKRVDIPSAIQGTKTHVAAGHRIVRWLGEKAGK